MITENVVNTSQHVLFRQRWSTATIYIVLVLIGGILLRFTGLANESYWVDEITTIRLLEGDLQVLLGQIFGGRPPVYMLSAFAWSQLFGVSEVATRSLTALASSVSLFMLYLLGKKLFNNRVALIATLLMALSAFQLYHAQDIRYYSFLTLFTLLSYLFFVYFLETARIYHVTLYCIASLLMFYSHSYGVFILASQSLFFTLFIFKHRSKIIPWLASQITIGLLIAPMLMAQMSGAGDGVMGWLPLPKFHELLRTFYRFIFGYDGQETIIAASIGIGIIILAALVGFLRSGASQKRKVARQLWSNALRESSGISPLILVGCWLIIPVISPFILSFVLGPMYLDRYVSTAAPALYLLIALAIVTLRQWVPLTLSVVIVTGMLIPGLHFFFTQDQKEQWYEVAAFIDEQSQENDVIVFTLDSHEARRALTQYYGGDLHLCQIEDGVAGQDSLISNNLEQCSNGHERVWLIERLPSTLYTYYITNDFLNQSDSLYIQEKYSFTQIDVYLLENSTTTREPL
jgi:4-amino-4-deoxy-L-arabinose transferase-like glycosyltransferase